MPAAHLQCISDRGDANWDCKIFDAHRAIWVSKQAQRERLPVALGKIGVLGRPEDPQRGIEWHKIAPSCWLAFAGYSSNGEFSRTRCLHAYPCTCSRSTELEPLPRLSPVGVPSRNTDMHSSASSRQRRLQLLSGDVSPGHIGDYLPRSRQYLTSSGIQKSSRWRNKTCHQSRRSPLYTIF